MSETASTLIIDEEGAGYLISVSDLMAGLLFVFIITLMAFVLSYQRATAETAKTEVELKETTIEREVERKRLQRERDQLQIEKKRLQTVIDDLTNAQRLRAEMLEKVRLELAALGIRVEVDTEHGILHLTENAIHFPSGQAVLPSQESEKLGRIAQVLQEVLPCYSANPPAGAVCEHRQRGKLESIFIEGHTDNVPYSRGKFEDNWDLSAQRAVFTYREMIVGEERLATLRNTDGFPIFSVSGYGEGRPRTHYQEPTPDAANRRIDLRFIMAPPRAEVGPLAELREKDL
jgi:flagellar motor protein MotB